MEKVKRLLSTDAEAVSVRVLLSHTLGQTRTLYIYIYTLTLSNAVSTHLLDQGCQTHSMEGVVSPGFCFFLSIKT